MDANKAKWYGILSTFVAAILQMFMCYALFTTLFWEEFTSRELKKWFEVFAHFSDFFIPILFFVCLRWAKRIGERVIIQKEKAYNVALHTLNLVLTVAYTLSMMAALGYQTLLENNHPKQGSIIILFLSIIMIGLIAIRLLNYIPTLLGAIPLARFLKRYQ